MKKIDQVCIIEDDPTHLFITKKYVELSGLVENIMIYKNGKEAYDKLKAIFISAQKLPEIILLDLNMPIWDGWQFLEEFLKIPIKSKINIFILTSSVSSEDRIQASKFNLNGKYLVKPITFSEIKSILAEI
ncbi:response regulator [Flavobacterium sp. UMI-01]|uniref:response regulator n=1 Tax=Flavobacterium sp. UMI-01 TaxID=1441053 RepID=UPI001C7D3C49|nr:response regulator [Flavobacterium sp. UMI-01]GIZ10347.1 response regulator [Flavobacterium sp. UMI-01]